MARGTLAITEADLLNEGDRAVAVARIALGGLKSFKRPCSAQAIRETYDEAVMVLWNMHHQANAMAHLHPDSETQETARRVKLKLQDELDAISMDPELYEIIRDTISSGAAGGDEEFLERLAARFELSGARLNEDRRRALEGRYRALNFFQTEFKKNLKDDQRLIVVDEHELVGLPESRRALLERSGSGRILQIPRDEEVVMSHVVSESVRRRAWFATLQRGSERRGDARQILMERDDIARRLGFDSAAHFSPGNRLRNSPDELETFLRDTANIAGKWNARDRAELLARKRRDFPDEAEVELQPWDLAYYRRKLSLERRSAREPLEPYLEFERVKAGLLDAVGDAFGIAIRKVEDVPTWHPDVEVFELFDEIRRRRLGRIYLDLHPRQNKESFHGWTFAMAGGRLHDHLPEGILVGNVPKPKNGERVSLEPRELLTFVHEMGHLVEMLFAGQLPWGTAAWSFTERSSSELAGMLVERLAWTPDFLRRCVGAPDLSDDLLAELQGLLQAERGRLWAQGDLEFAVAALALHRLKDPRTARLEQAVEELGLSFGFDSLSAKTLILRYLASPHFADYDVFYFTYLRALFLGEAHCPGGPTSRSIRPIADARFSRGDLVAPEALDARYLGAPPDLVAAAERWYAASVL